MYGYGAKWTGTDIAENQIEQAKKLLQIDSIKLTEIAARLGFQNQNYFSSVFKKNTGLSPRNWAKNHH